MAFGWGDLFSPPVLPEVSRSVMDGRLGGTRST